MVIFIYLFSSFGKIGRDTQPIKFGTKLWDEKWGSIFKFPFIDIKVKKIVWFDQLEALQQASP